MNETNAGKGMAIASLVLGILSCTIYCGIGGLLGIVGMFLSIISLGRRLGGKGMAIGGLVTSIMGILIGFVMFGLVMSPDFQEGFREGFQKGFEAGYGGAYDFGEDHPELSGAYVADDGSTIYFYSDQTFDWYRDEENSQDVKSGNYSVVFGDDAEDMLTTDLSEYGVTQQELDDYYERNAGDTFYKKENLTVLTLETTSIEMEDNPGIDLPYTVYYYGYCDGETFDGANMGSANYFSLQRKE